MTPPTASADKVVPALVAELYRRGIIDWAYLERWSDAEMAQLLRAAATMDESELVAKLKAL